jgi:hypothetical protein
MPTGPALAALLGASLVPKVDDFTRRCHSHR